MGPKREEKTDLRLAFDEDTANYDKYRPAYAPALFEELLAYAAPGRGKRALEIGVGTGQATLPILETGCSVTAVELGEHLAAYVRQKFSSYPAFQVVTGDFAEFSGGGFDLLYSATAFHWIPDDVGYPKALDLLKSGGALALFWNHPFVARADCPLHCEIQKAYQKYRPASTPPAEFRAEDCAKILERLERYGFTDTRAKLFYQTRTLAAEEYICLLNTYSDHRALPEAARRGLEGEITDAIRRFGGTLNIYDTMDLYLARKP